MPEAAPIIKTQNAAPNVNSTETETLPWRRGAACKKATGWLTRVSHSRLFYKILRWRIGM